MPHVILSARAQSDISRLHKFLLEKDINVARRAVVAIRDAFLPLKHTPMIGRPVDEHPELRELTIAFGSSGYLAMYCYEPTDDTVTILAIKHQREDDYK